MVAIWWLVESQSVHVMTKDGKIDAHVAVQVCTFMQSYIVTHACLSISMYISSVMLR